jgi:hypothetical protein
LQIAASQPKEKVYKDQLYIAKRVLSSVGLHTTVAKIAL